MSTQPHQPRALFFSKARGWWGTEHGGSHVKQAPQGPGSGGSAGTGAPVLPSSASLSTLDEARAWWRAHLGGKTLALTVHSGGKAYPIKVRFDADNTHAFTADIGGQQKTGKRGFDPDRAHALGRLLQVIDHPQRRLRDWDADLLLEQRIGGRHYTVVLKWEAGDTYRFSSAHFKTIEDVTRLFRRQNPRKNNGPLQKSEPSSAFPDASSPHGAGVIPFGVTSAALGSGQTSPHAEAAAAFSIDHPNPLRKTAPMPMLLIFPNPAHHALVKAYIHGHYRLNTKTGARHWVESYSDKRPERGRTEFAHMAHREAHVNHHLAHGRQREALHAFHDLNADDSHSLARRLFLVDPEHDAKDFGSKKALMEAIHGNLKRKREVLSRQVAAQVKDDFERRKAAGTVGKKPVKIVRAAEKPAEPEREEIPESAKQHFDSILDPAKRFSEGLDRARKTDKQFQGEGRYAAEAYKNSRDNLESFYSRVGKQLDSIDDPKRREIARQYFVDNTPNVDLTADEAEFFRDFKPVEKPGWMGAKSPQAPAPRALIGSTPADRAAIAGAPNAKPKPASAPASAKPEPPDPLSITPKQLTEKAPRKPFRVGFVARAFDTNYFKVWLPDLKRDMEVGILDSGEFKPFPPEIDAETAAHIKADVTQWEYERDRNGLDDLRKKGHKIEQQYEDMLAQKKALADRYAVRSPGAEKPAAPAKPPAPKPARAAKPKASPAPDIAKQLQDPQTTRTDLDRALLKLTNRMNAALRAGDHVKSDALEAMKQQVRDAVPAAEERSRARLAEERRKLKAPLAKSLPHIFPASR